MIPMPAGLTFSDFDRTLLNQGPSVGSGLSIDATRYARGTDRPGFQQRSIRALDWLRTKNPESAQSLIEACRQELAPILQRMREVRPEEARIEGYEVRLASALAGEHLLMWARGAVQEKGPATAL